MQPKENCPTLWGNISIAFPFGTELGCFAKLPLYLTCNPRPSPILQMPDGSVVTDISIDEGILRILNFSDTGSSLAYLGAPLYAFSGEHGVLTWAVDNKTCKDAMASEDYRCFSNSDCLDVTDEMLSLNHVGYQCKCSHGFGGNPYLRYGCTSISTGKHQRESKLVILGKLLTQFLNIRPGDYMIVFQIIELPSWITCRLSKKITASVSQVYTQCRCDHYVRLISNPKLGPTA